MSAPSAWLAFSVDAVTAVGTLGAVIVAVGVASRERRDRIAAQRELAQARDAERQAQAGQVTCSVRASRRASIASALDQDPSPRKAVAAWRIEVRNNSPYPIRAVRLTVHPAGSPDIVHNLDVAKVIDPGSEAKGLGPAAPEIDKATPEYELTFRDVHGVLWRLDQNDELKEVNAR